MKILNNAKRERGITLIALIITIIVLIILAMISIAMISGQNSTVSKASQAKIENAHAEVFERLSLEAQAHYALVLYDGYSGTILDYLKDELKYVKEDNTVDMNTLLNGHLLVTGNGSNGKDVYKVEEQTTETEKKKYDVNYYDENGEVTKIGELINNTLPAGSGSSSSGGGSSPQEKDTEPPTITSFTADGATLKAKVKDNVGVTAYCFNQSEEVREDEWITVDAPHTEEKEYTHTADKSRHLVLPRP